VSCSIDNTMQYTGFSFSCPGEMHMHTNCIGVVHWGCNGVVNEEKQPLVGYFCDAFPCH